MKDGESKIRLQGRNGCQGDGDGDQAANTVRANELRLQGFNVSKNDL